MNTDNFTVWQRRECPAWCTERHTHTTDRTDRACLYEPPGVPLSMNDAYPASDERGPHLPEASAALEQAPREYEPHVLLALPSNAEELTLAEAESLSSLLARLVHEAREGIKGVDWR